MTQWSPVDHPRAGDGRFTQTTRTDPGDTILDDVVVLPPPGSPAPAFCPMHNGPWGTSMSCVCTDNFKRPRPLDEAVREARRHDLPVRQGTHPGIDRLIGLGFLSPAARDMDPREAVDQWCEANAATLRERHDMLGAIGQMPRLRPADLSVGDTVDLVPVVARYSNTVDPAAEIAAEFEYAQIVEPTTVERSLAAGYGGKVAVIHTDQGSWAVDENDELDVHPDFDGTRCNNCGEPVGLDQDRINGHCARPDTYKVRSFR